MVNLLMTVNTRTIPSLRLKLRLLVNRQVMKMTTRRNNTRKTTKMFVQLGVSQINRSFDVGGITSIVGGEVGQTHNALRDNISSNFVGYTSFLALNYVPGLGPFCEYFNCVVCISIYRIV